MKNIKALRRISVLKKITSLTEFFFILFHHFVTKKLADKRPDLHRLLLFVVGCTDHLIEISLEDELLRLDWEYKGVQNKFWVRKYSRDLFVFGDFYIHRDYEPFIEVLHQKKSADFKFIIDAGANIGCSALYFHNIYPSATIICIEPEDSNFYLLEKNTNHLGGKVISLKKALWPVETILELMQRDWSHDGFLVMKSEKNDEVIAKVPTVTIPALIDEYKIESIDLLKIDIEGAEKAFFENDSDLLNLISKAQCVFMEVHPEFISEEEVMERFIQHQFECKPIFITGQPVAIFATQ